jgi:hypothetical protein
LLLLSELLVAISSYTAYFNLLGQYDVTSLEQCGNNLLECANAKNSTQANLEECKHDLNRTLSILEGLSPIQSQLTVCRTDLSSLQQSLSDSIAKANALLSNATTCQQDLVSCQNTLNDCNITRQNLIGNLSSCNANFTALQTGYNTLAQNVAKDLCCIYKIGNPSLKYYYVKDDKINCVSEANETLGTKEFTC